MPGKRTLRHEESTMSSESRTPSALDEAFPVGTRVRVNGDPVLATVVPRPPMRYIYVRFDGEPDHVKHPMTCEELEVVHDRT